MWRAMLVFALAVFALSGCSGHPSMDALQPKGTAGEIQLDLIKWSFIMMLGVFTVVITIFVYVLIRFRKRKGKDIMPEQVHGNNWLELAWTVIPIILLAILAVPTVKYTFQLSDTKPGPDTLEVKVTGHQYWWEFEYPELGIKTAQELYIPVNTKVHLEIEGRDVLHSFWVPALGGKTDVIPGRTNTMWLDAKKPGPYQGKCAELCGAGHALMDFKVVAQTEDDFDKWVAQMKNPPQPITTSAQKEGEEIFRQNCIGCHAGANAKILGPDLSKFGTRDTIAGILPHNKESLKQWLKNPEAVKPGAKMPKIDYLEDKELDALMDYLMSRK
ncbi:cytochrome c oxidase subunit II [Paenactinomyces guangxiensis]|uniref:Cytochrome c oxidase subunit 2 n=2 Tax=Paenactinomyces guangxiensis TaxID=1490290 RepID=A0A7W2AA11_9BACL|nr:cytochrome c oxidase subunit II [Paenactinomyces guangxiensis]MBH8592424.1 cytochrome c oxidase subunit II [Paenactinomyces guangxiensis]